MSWVAPRGRPQASMAASTACFRIGRPPSLVAGSGRIGSFRVQSGECLSYPSGKNAGDKGPTAYFWTLLQAKYWQLLNGIASAEGQTRSPMPKPFPQARSRANISISNLRSSINPHNPGMSRNSYNPGRPHKACSKELPVRKAASACLSVADCLKVRIAPTLARRAESNFGQGLHP
jgi:hypothetical protein